MAMGRIDLQQSGIDYAEAMERFGGNEALYHRLAVKFLDDPQFAALTKAMDAGDIEAARRAAHSLKGLAGNLSFTDLYQAACKLNEALNADDLDTAWELLPNAQIAYDRVCDALRSMQD